MGTAGGVRSGRPARLPRVQAGGFKNAPFLDPLEEGVKAFHRSMMDATYAFGREDLPFMDGAARCSEEIPFYTLLKQINETHRRGIDVDGED